MARYRRYRRPRAPKKPDITVKVKPAKRRGTCTGCGGKFQAGEDVAYVRHRVKRYHAHTCVPANVLNPTPPVAGGAATPPPAPQTPTDALHAALLAVETALVLRAKQEGITDSLEKQFARYAKVKAVALRPGTPGEERAAVRRALIDAVNLVF